MIRTLSDTTSRGASGKIPAKVPDRCTSQSTSLHARSRRRRGQGGGRNDRPSLVMHRPRTSSLLVVAAKDRQQKLDRAQTAVRGLGLMSPIIIHRILDGHTVGAIFLEQRIRVRDRADLVKDRFVEVHLVGLGRNAVKAHDAGTIDDFDRDRAFQKRLTVDEIGEEVVVEVLRFKLDQTLVVRAPEVLLLRGRDEGCVEVLCEGWIGICYADDACGDEAGVGLAVDGEQDGRHVRCDPADACPADVELRCVRGLEFGGPFARQRLVLGQHILGFQSMSQSTKWKTYTSRVSPHRDRRIRLNLGDVRRCERCPDRVQRGPARACAHGVLASRILVVCRIHDPALTQPKRKPRVESVRPALLQDIRGRAVDIRRVVDDLVAQQFGEVRVWRDDDGGDRGGGVAEGGRGAVQELVGVGVGDVDQWVGHDSVGEDGARFGRLPVARGYVEGVLLGWEACWCRCAGDDGEEGQEGEKEGGWCHRGACGMVSGSC